jgi:hypothetical protein
MAQTSIWQQILDYSNRADPYPLYTELRKTPVVGEEDGSYVVSTFREIVALLHDPRLSSDFRNIPELAAYASEEVVPEVPPSFIATDGINWVHCTKLIPTVLRSGFDRDAEHAEHVRLRPE